MIILIYHDHIFSQSKFLPGFMEQIPAAACWLPSRLDKDVIFQGGLICRGMVLRILT